MTAAGTALFWVAVAAAGTAVAWWGSRRLERSAAALSRHYGLPLAVRGAVVLAVGSSFPDFSAAVLSTLIHGEFDLGVGVIVGSAVFNVLVIPALSALAGEREGVAASHLIVYKEAQFYMVAVSAIVITLALAVIYRPVPGEALRGEVWPGLAAVPLALYGVYVFTQHQDVAEGETAPEAVESVSRQWLLLLASLLVIGVAVEGLVRSTLAFGDVFGVAPFLWGATVVAAAISLPDALVSVRAAVREEGVTALGNVFGSNTFDLLVAVPAGVLVAGGAVVNFSAALPLFAALVLCTVAAFSLLRTDLSLSPAEAYGLLALYAAFLTWLAAEALGRTHLLPGL